MFSFMLGVLGSGIFWIGFGVASFIIGSLTVRHYAPNTYHYMITGERNQSPCHEGRCDPVNMVSLTLIHMIFWPLILLGVGFAVITKVVFMKIAWPLFRAGFKATATIVPDIEINVKK